MVLKDTNKKKDSEIKATLLFLDNVSKIFSFDNMKKTGLYGYVYDFSVDYDTIDNDDFSDMQRLLMEKHDMK